jgi:hypothetical protein
MLHEIQEHNVQVGGVVDQNKLSLLRSFSKNITLNPQQLGFTIHPKSKHGMCAFSAK